MKQIYIVGGDKAVSKDIENVLVAYGKVDRISGENRRETSIAIAEKFFGTGEKAGAAILAYAKNFPDGLCGGPLAAALNIPMLLTSDGKTVEAETYAADIDAGYVLGGEKALADQSVIDVFGLQSAEDIILK